MRPSPGGTLLHSIGEITLKIKTQDTLEKTFILHAGSLEIKRILGQPIYHTAQAYHIEKNLLA